MEFDRLRFDFNLPRPMTPQEINTVETLINSWIQSSTALTTRVMPLTEAKAGGATAMFGEKYSDVVRVVEVPGVSMELCGGTHVASTGDIGGFKVLSETGIASGMCFLRVLWVGVVGGCCAWVVACVLGVCVFLGG